MKTACLGSSRRLFVALAVFGCAACLAGNETSVKPLDVGKPLIAYWSFDEIFGSTCGDSAGKGYDAAPAYPTANLRRVEGLFGNAMAFAGSLMLSAPGKPDFSGWRALSLSVWVMPTDLTGFREIFRKEDAENRVLFSFQNDGTILSLGLNIGGYVECDAPMKPEQVLDGKWHHCAATFDGDSMRVYLDGKEIGVVKRPGTISAGGVAPGCIGSSSGGENFQGIMDDLRIYSEALTAQDVAQLHDNGLAAMARTFETVESGEPKVDKPLLAHWTFNEPGLGATMRSSTEDRSTDVTAKSLVLHVRGVHGKALSLAGEDALTTAGWPEVSKMQGITFSAWVMPTDLSGFREIFRKEDGENRILFSFQESGTVLSLGLNVGGYVECDAPINRDAVADGQWHHCAATFDGKTMRVYLDGKEIGARERPGDITATPKTPGFVGSSDGTSEWLQGGLDDLRIYSAALTPAEIVGLHDVGARALDVYAQQLQGQLAALYQKAPTFAETLADSRRRMVEGKGGLDLDLAGMLLRRMRADFPEDSANYSVWTGASPLEFMAARGDDYELAQAGRLVGLLLECKPLTEHQKAKETSEQARAWEQADAVARKLEELKAKGAAARFSPEWISMVLEAGKHVQFRPYMAEPVAPYIKPATPVTKDLASGEARDVLVRDWMHQCGGNPSPERIRQEIGWARQVATRIESESGGKVDLTKQRTNLADLGKQAQALKAPDRDLYVKVREVKRDITFRSPAVDFDRVLYVDMPYPQGSEWQHETRHREGYMAVPGARLMIQQGLSPAGHLTQLMPQAPLHGSFWRPDLSYDAKTVLFCFKPHNEKSFHLYEIGIDGKGLTQLTDGPYDDFDPIYLPDDKHIIFSTTRANTYVRCMPPTNAYILARCDRDGKNIYLISCNNEPDYLPSVMDNGKILYTRWEYTDKPLWRAQSLWTMNPDGTQVASYWGNQSVWPDLLKDARCIPGSNRVMFTGSAHHNWFSGSVAILDPARGLNFPDGLTKVTADTAWPEVGNGPVDPIESATYHPSGAYEAYYSPYPLSEHEFLVSASRGGKFVLYLMDTDGNRELVYEGVNNIFHAIPVRPRTKPPVIPDAVTWPDRAHRTHPEDGFIYSASVYQGVPEEVKGKVRFLRVMAIQPKTYTYWYKRPYASTGPVVSMVQSDGVKQVLGTVPVESDGSVYFRAPAGKALHFQLLDENQRALQTMRSFTGVMPGERRGCLGCHELNPVTPSAGTQPLAMSREPSKITPPPWAEDTVGYTRYVQPVLDKYCGSCHEGEGEARKVLDLTQRPGYAMFDEPYVTLTGSPAWGAPYTPPAKPPPGFGIADTLMVEGYSTTDPKAYVTPAPMTALSYRSKLIDIASSGKHHGVKVDAVSLLRLICWVDAMCPFYGEEEIRAEPDPGFQGVDWLAVRPRLKTAPRIVRPGPVD